MIQVVKAEWQYNLTAICTHTLARAHARTSIHVHIPPILHPLILIQLWNLDSVERAAASRTLRRHGGGTLHAFTAAARRRHGGGKSHKRRRQVPHTAHAPSPF
jgi:hypothetical protein